MKEFAVDHWKRSPARRLSATANENMRFDQHETRRHQTVAARAEDYSPSKRRMVA